MKPWIRNLALIVVSCVTAGGHIVAGAYGQSLQLKGIVEEKPNQLPKKGNDDTEGWSKPVNGIKVRLFVSTPPLDSLPFTATIGVERLMPERPSVAILFGPGAITKIELTDKNGKPVPFRLETPYVGGVYGFGFFPGESPFGSFGESLKSGVYTLQVTIESERNPLEPELWNGRIVSNKASFTIAEAGTPQPTMVDHADSRKFVDDLIKDLDSDNAATRKDSEESLSFFCLELLPYIEKLVPKVSQRAAAHLKNLEKVAAETLVSDKFKWDDRARPKDYDDKTWQALESHLDDFSKTKLKAMRACYLPLLKLPEKDLVAMLDHDDPATRVLALRSLPKTKDKNTLKKLVNCLHSEWGSPETEILRQGKEVIPILLELKGKPFPEPLFWNFDPLVVGLLGKLGPSEESEQFLIKVLQSNQSYDHGEALNALIRWGPAGVPTLLKIPQDETKHPLYRQQALEQLIRLLSAEELAPMVKKLAESDVPSDLTWAALHGIQKFKLGDVFPHVKRLALSEAADVHVRVKAIDALIGKGDKIEMETVLSTLIGPQSHRLVRMNAMSRAAKAKVIGVLPKILDALADASNEIRYEADSALRVLANLPEGVGFDGANPNPLLWRKWWDSKK